MGEVLRRTKGGRFLGFYLRFYESGRRRVLASKQPTHAEARRMLIEIEARIARGEAGLSPRRTDWPTVSALVERFTREYQRPRIKDIERYRAERKTALKKALPALGKLSAAQIREEDIAKLRDSLSQRFAAGTVRNVLASLSVLFSWSMKRGLAPQNPCRGVERPAAEQCLDFLGREEARRLLDTAAGATTLLGRMQHVAIALALHTGLRKGELFGLRWIDLDTHARRLTVARSYRSTPKSGKTRHLRLPSQLVPLLQAWREQCPPSPDGLVLPCGLTEGQMTRSDAMLGLPRLMQTANIRPIRHCWHVLRHTFASHFIMSGGNILTLSKILGHSDVKVTMIYAHLAPDFLSDEMDRLKY
ncbi:MAG TPA: tyrosine-type recombinase/integrase [Pseudomonadota bacterium]|nr:tyrosine-type recombinase/integrase [Pseudomonadota bacterium]